MSQWINQLPEQEKTERTERNSPLLKRCETAPSAKCPPTLDELLKRVHDLPTLPHAALKVMKMTRGVEVSPREIGDAVSKDPNFAARVLKLANSSYYGLPRSVGTLTEAVMMLGNRTIRNLTIVAATHQTLSQDLPGYDLSANELWKHSIAGAHVSIYLAEAAHYPYTEEAFVAGLLHDVGKLILSIYVRDFTEDIHFYMKNNVCSFVQAEKAVLGFDHGEVGGHIARQWNLPTPLVQAIAWHHAPLQKGQIIPLVGITHLADFVCICAGIGVGTNRVGEDLSEGVLETLNLTRNDVENALSFITDMMDGTKGSDAVPLPKAA